MFFWSTELRNCGEGETGGLYHGGWAFRKSAFYKVIGYGPHNNGEDQELAGRLCGAGLTECDPCKFADPFYVYRIDNNSYHLSYMDDRGYRELWSKRNDRDDQYPDWRSRDWAGLPVIRRFAFGAHVNPKTDDGKMPVELIGPVVQPGGNGPSNGMFALQSELRKRIDDGLDWLSIKSLPVSKGAMPWFWNWNDRRYAMWWDAEGLPLSKAPTCFSPIPRRHESTAKNARCSMHRIVEQLFCHSDWYRDLIAKHRGANNKSEIVMWPYPIDPWPGGPLPDKIRPVDLCQERQPPTTS